MQLEDFINYDIPCLGKDTSVEEALTIINKFHITELPLIEEDKLVNLIREEKLSKYKKDKITVGEMEGAVFLVGVQNRAHPYEAASRMIEYKLSLLPVLDEHENYMGLLTAKDLFRWFLKDSGLERPGGIIVLTMMPPDYSLAEIARICESNDTTILNLQISFLPDDKMMDVILKINKADLQSLKSSFERFGYKIKEVFGRLPEQDDLMNRYRLLMDYLDM